MTYPLMRAKHAEMSREAGHDVVVEVPDNDYYRSLGWEPVDPDTPTTVEAQRAEEGRAFQVASQSARPAEEVAAQVAAADPEEQQRVKETERAGKGRKTVLEAADEG